MKRLKLYICICFALYCWNGCAANDNDNMTMDERIIAGMEKSHDAQLIQDDSTVKVELDMLYRKKDWEIINQLNGGQLSPRKTRRSERKKRKALRNTARRWTNKEVVYYINTGYFTSADIYQINLSINEWRQYTCLTFRTRTSSDRNYVDISTGNGCSSYVGMIGGAQRLSLANGCRVKSVIVHELGHAIGFHHEQTRPDRDSYVRINYQNIMSGVEFNFQRYSTSVINDHSVPYDYRSVMHYGQNAFSANGRATITTIDPSYQSIIGRAGGLSFRDIKLANLMYNCAAPCRSMTCPGKGYVGKDCRCYCPGSPVQLCNGGEGTASPGPTSQPSTPNPPTCTDDNANCGYWASVGECQNNPNYMLVYCKKSCNECGGGSNCNDNNANCNYWASVGECSKNPNYMLLYCKRSCNVCEGRSNCNDNNASCNYWASVGECSKNPNYMLFHCKRSCNSC